MKTREQLIEQDTLDILATEKKIAALVGHLNATRAHRYALVNGECGRTLCVLENAFGSTEISLLSEYRLKTDEEIVQAVLDSEQYLEKWFNGRFIKEGKEV